MDEAGGGERAGAYGVCADGSLRQLGLSSPSLQDVADCGTAAVLIVAAFIVRGGDRDVAPQITGYPSKKG
jgi:hypothetical protein